MGGHGAKRISGATPSTREGDEDSALRGELGTVKGEVGCRAGKDVTQVMRLFFCDGNDFLPFPVLCLLVLWFEDRGEGVFFRFGVCNGTVLSQDFWMLAGLLDGVDGAMLSLPDGAIHSSTVAASEKQESKGSLSCSPPL